MIVSLFVFVVILILSIPSAIIFIPLTLIIRNVGPLYAVVCFIVRTGFRVAGIRVFVEGRQNVPPHQACIFMANHVSNLDPPGLIPRIPGRTSAFAKRSLFSIPIFGYCLKLGEYIPVDRSRSVSGAQECVSRSPPHSCRRDPRHDLRRGTPQKTGACSPSRRAQVLSRHGARAPCILSPSMAPKHSWPKAASPSSPARSLRLSPAPLSRQLAPREGLSGCPSFHRLRSPGIDAQPSDKPLAQRSI